MKYVDYLDFLADLILVFSSVAISIYFFGINHGKYVSYIFLSAVGMKLLYWKSISNTKKKEDSYTGD